MAHEFKEGDMVRVTNTTFGDGFNRRGQVGKIVSRPTEYCVNYHKGSYETLCDVIFADGKTVELSVAELDVADAIDQLGALAPEDG